MRLQLQGTITKWNDDKGFGFITPLSGEKQVFVHIKAVKRHHERPKLGQVVYYSISKDKQGRACAADVSYVEKEHLSPLRIMLQIAAFIFVALFFAALAVLTFVLQIIPVFIIALYAIASGITFFAYASDKSAAKNGRWRTAETTLHTMEFFGGWPGALLAQQTLRHKSTKAAYQGEYKFTVVLNVALTTWFLTPRGPELTMAFLEKLVKIIS